MKFWSATRKKTVLQSYRNLKLETDFELRRLKCVFNHETIKFSFVTSKFNSRDENFLECCSRKLSAERSTFPRLSVFIRSLPFFKVIQTLFALPALDRFKKKSKIKRATNINGESRRSLSVLRKRAKENGKTLCFLSFQQPQE